MFQATHYRFSISWPRLMPNGTKDNINQAGIDYYNKVIDALLDAGINESTKVKTANRTAYV